MAAVGLAVSTGAVERRTVPDGEIVFGDGDYVIVGARGTAGAAPAVTQGGYTTYGDIGLRQAYTVRLVASDGMTVIGPRVRAAVETITAVVDIDLDVVEVEPDRGPGVGQIDVVVSSAAPCGAPWLGCASPYVDDGEVKAARVWINPRLLSKPSTEIDNTVRHELGHALGLGHYNAEHEGRIQTMHATIPDALRYESGDLAGLVALSRRPARSAPGGAATPSTPPTTTPAPEVTGVDPIGTVHTVLPTGVGIVIRGRALDPQTTDPITVVLTLDGHRFEVVAGGRDDTVGDLHAFEVVWPVPPGPHDLCVQARNVGPGTDTSLGCETVLVSDSTIGQLGLQTV